MNWNYENYITIELLRLQSQMGLSNFNFEIETEQAFVKRKDYDENTIYIVIKYLGDEKTIGADTQPVQFLILSEQNSLDVARALFEKFAETHNWKVETHSYVVDGVTRTEFIKQQYSSPVVLSNFNPVLYGYRSVMYMTSNLYVMSSLIDFKRIEIDSVKVEPLNLVLGYSMTPNTQQLKDENISSSVKSVSSLSMSLTVPMQDTDFVTKVLGIIAETNTGDEAFSISIYTEYNEGSETNTPAISVDMKLISAQITTAVNQIPGIQVGLMK